VDKALYKQKQPHIHRPLVLMGDFNYSNICWSDNIAGHKESRRFLKCINDNFLFQVIEKPIRSILLDFTLTNKQGLSGNVKVKSILGCSDHEMVEFRKLK